MSQIGLVMEIRKMLKLSNEITTYQSMWGAGKHYSERIFR